MRERLRAIDTRSRFEKQNARTGTRQRIAGERAGDAGADDHDVGVQNIRHVAFAGGLAQ
jgi:hypothetical protein